MKISEAVWQVIDTETSGLDPTKDRICEFASIDSFGNEVQMLVNPGVPIPCDVSGVTHLTDDDVAEAAQWEHAMELIPQLVPVGNVIVAHNAVFDQGFLPCLADRSWVCSMRLAQHLIPNAPNYKNQTLRYLFGGAKLDLHGLESHRALADVIVTQFVFKKLIERYLAQDRDDDVDALIAFANSPILVTRPLWFGKHRGLTIDKCPSDYIAWALSPRGMADMEDDLRYTFETELAKRRA